MLPGWRQVEMELLIGRAGISPGATGPGFILRSVFLAHRGLWFKFLFPVDPV